MDFNNGVIGVVLELVKSIVIAVFFCLAAVLVFAFVISLASLPSTVITPVNQVIKAAAILLGCIVGLGDSRGLIKGAVVGLFSIFFSFLLFSFIGGALQFTPTFALELLFGAIAGGISGVVAVNLHK